MEIIVGTRELHRVPVTDISLFVYVMSCGRFYSCVCMGHVIINKSTVSCTTLNVFLNKMHYMNT
jgi:hypothetical protein